MPTVDAALDGNRVCRLPASRSACGGLASIEMVLLIPFMLVLIMLLTNIGKFWHAKLDNRIAARTSAWRAAEFDSVDLLLTGKVSCSFDSAQLERADAALARFTDALGRVKFQRRCSEASPNAQSLITAMNSGTGGQARKSAFAGILKAPANQPIATTGEAFRTWTTSGLADQSAFWLSDSHTLDIAGKSKTISDPWLRKELPNGYDAYLLKELLGGTSTGGADAQEIACLEQQRKDAELFEPYEACLAGLTPEEAAEEDTEKRCGDKPPTPGTCP